MVLFVKPVFGKVALMVLLLVSIPAFAFANGGPVNWTELLQTGNITFLNQADIELVEEHIRFAIDGDRAHVRVEYKLLNNGDVQELTYGFPIDMMKNREGTVNTDALSEEITDFSVSLDGREIEFSRLSETDDLRYSIPTVWDESGVTEVDALRLYYVGTIRLSPGEIRTLRVSYSVEVQLLDIVVTKSIIPSYTHRMLLYDLSPSASWGSGSVGGFSMEIDVSGIRRVGGEVLSLPPGGTYVEEDLYRFEAENYDLQRADRVVISYDISGYLTAKFFDARRIPRSRIRSIQASSTLAPGSSWSYEVENLLDGDPHSVWVEGARGNGIGEYIELEIENFNVGYIGIINGFTHSEDFYNRNSRLTKVRYEIEADPDGPFFWGDTTMREGESGVTDKGFNVVTEYNYPSHTQRIFGSGEAGFPVKRLRIYIEGAVSGDVWEDLCISELVILGYRYEDLR